MRIVLRRSALTLLCVALVAATLAVRAQVAADVIHAHFSQSRSTLGRARALEAERYAPELFRAMEETWVQAGKSLAAANANDFYERDYLRAEYLAVSARRLAVAAAIQAIDVRGAMGRDIAAQLAVVDERLHRFRGEFQDVPMDKSLRRDFVLGEMLASEGRSAYARGDYPRAVEKIRLAGSHLGTADSAASRLVEECNAYAPKWKQWVAETIAWSASQDCRAIVVDKFAHECRVYRNGALEVDFPVEMGSRWLGPKRYRGDRATPEGRYRITKKKGQGETTYYKALEINYPNEQDWEIFRLAKRRGEISAGARIGGLIQIHGEGGRGANWTQGCIALANSDMDRLFRIVGIGTPVTIVGSSQGRLSLTSAGRAGGDDAGSGGLLARLEKEAVD